MCRNIRNLFNFEPPVTPEEVQAAALQFVRKISGFTKPSKANEPAFLAAVEEVAGVDLMTARAQKGEGDAFALSHDSFVGMLPQVPGARVLPGQFQQTGVSVAVPKGRGGALRLASDLLEGAKASGLVRRALDAAGFTDAAVAP